MPEEEVASHPAQRHALKGANLRAQPATVAAGGIYHGKAFGVGGYGLIATIPAGNHALPAAAAAHPLDLGNDLYAAIKAAVCGKEGQRAPHQLGEAMPLRSR